tara:strand:+ start:5428 stop:5925 length:498 start_codon:yes stop_codon:yes gene_type:complete
VLFNNTLRQKAELLLSQFQELGLCLVTAESCTGGLVSSCLTAIPGASEVVEGGIVSYSNQAKQALLGVPTPLIISHGAVSKEVVCAMAEGALTRTRADISVAITGIAGPGGGTKEKPVGLVYFGVAWANKPTKFISRQFKGNRSQIQLDSVDMAIDFLLKSVQKL